MLKMHGLSNLATVVYAPLVEHTIDGEKFLWYDPRALEGIESADLLVVDGPPGRVCPLARYPALPKLAPKLAANAAILLDDGDRSSEQEIVQRWCAKYPSLKSTYLSTEKGGFELRWGC
jgi:hypothetical protein